MTQAAFGGTPFSTRVDLWLECEHGVVPLAQAGAEFVIAVEPVHIPACEAYVIVSVDGQQHRNRVRLIHGLSADNPRAKTVACDNDGLPF